MKRHFLILSALYAALVSIPITWANAADGHGHSGRGGSGLGLAIVDRLATASGGTAELRPADGGGTDAVITLPTPPAPSLSPSPPAPATDR